MAIWPNDSSTSCSTAPLTPSSRTRTLEPPPRIADGDLFLVARPHDFEQLVDVSRTDEVLGRTADLHPRVRSERLVTKRDVFEGVE